MSIHVYKHRVEDSAPCATHVVYFRDPAHRDPPDRPLPESPKGYRWVEKDYAVGIERDDPGPLVEAGIFPPAGTGIARLGHQLRKRLGGKDRLIAARFVHRHGTG